MVKLLKSVTRGLCDATSTVTFSATKPPYITILIGTTFSDSGTSF